MQRQAISPVDKPESREPIGLPVPAPVVRRCLDTPLAYTAVWRDMQAFTDDAQPGDADQFWLLCHQPVFTQGSNGRPEHLLEPGAIPVVASDRGGQITYHGPGQLMVYVLADVRRLGLGVRALVQALENAVIATLAGYNIHAQARRDAPGVYVPAAGMAKIGSIGLRIRRGRCYHGLALNVAMDLAPFERINPCGLIGQPMTQISALGGPMRLATVVDDMLPQLIRHLGMAAPDGHLL